MGVDAEFFVETLMKPKLKVGKDFVKKGQNKDQVFDVYVARMQRGMNLFKLTHEARSDERVSERASDQTSARA